METSLDSTQIDINSLIQLNCDKLQIFFDEIKDEKQFCQNLIELTLSDPSVASIKVLSAIFQLPTNFKLREEMLLFFGPPVFVKLSQARLISELNVCQDQRLRELVENISNETNDSSIKLQSEFFLNFVQIVINSTEIELVEEAVKLIIILLSQPSSRRFIKPLLEDLLFSSILKFKLINIDLLKSYENAFHFQINEVNGVCYDNYENYVTYHFSKIRFLQSKCLGVPELEFFANIPQNSFHSYQSIILSIANLSLIQFQLLLLQMGYDGYSKELPVNIFMDAIASNLALQSSEFVNTVSLYPTESNLFSVSTLTPLTAESLSHRDLFQRHLKLLQTNIFGEISQFVRENITLCKPVLNRNDKTEFSGYTRDAIEILSSAIVKTSCPDVQHQGKYQKIELEVTISLSALDQFSLKSWTDLKYSETLFVCHIIALPNDDYELKYLRSVTIDSKSISKNILTLNLLIDPDQFDIFERTEVYSKLNFIMKRSSSESNDVRILRSISTEMNSSFPEFIEDILLGINHPDEIECFADQIDSSNPIFNTILNSGLSLIDGPFGSGLTSSIRDISNRLYKENSNTVVLFRSGPAIDNFYKELIKTGIPDYQIVRLGFSSNSNHIHQKYSNLVKTYVEIINNEILTGFEYNSSIYTCGEADYIMRCLIEPQWKAFKVLLDNSGTQSFDLASIYPFAKCDRFDGLNFQDHYNWICSVFSIAKQLAPIELLRSSSNISNYVLSNVAKIVLMTSKYAAINVKSLSQSGLSFETLLVDDCNLIPEIEILLALNAQNDPSYLKRLGLFGHLSGGRPICFNEKLKAAGLSISLMDRFISSGFSKIIKLEHSLSQMKKSDIFRDSRLFVPVPCLLGKGEESPMRNYIQNLDEAEYAVALFQYLRLRGINADDIAIIAPYNGQVDLIKEIIKSRCSWTEFYTDPAFIGTLDQSIGLHFKHVIVSLVRTKSLGFLSESSRLQLAFSRASENLVVLASTDLFAKSFEFSALTLKDGKSFNNVEEFSKFVYDLSLKNIQN